MAFKLETFTSLQEIPSLYDPLFSQEGCGSVFFSRPWFDLLVDHGFEHAPAIRALGVRKNDTAALLLLLKDERQSGQSLSSLSNYYSMDFAPLASNRLSPDDLQEAFSLVSHHLASDSSNWSTLSLHPLPCDSPLIDNMTKAFSLNGIELLALPNDTNWFADTVGATPQSFSATLPTKLTNTLRRKEKAATEEGHLSYKYVSSTAELPIGVADYFSIYQRSWKPTEPDPNFMPLFMELCAKNRSLRLGILHMDDTPVAVQFWIVEGTTALLYKLAHDPAYDHLSVGTLLTRHMINEILSRDRPERLSFGLGNEPFKQSWMPQHTSMVTLIAHNRRKPRGLYRAWRQK